MALDPALVERPYPFQNLVGFRILEWSEDFARFELPMGEHLGNRYGIPHGGVYATLLDTVMGFAGCFTGSAEDRRLAMTLSLNVNYLAVPQGDRLVSISVGLIPFAQDAAVAGWLLGAGPVRRFRHFGIPAFWNPRILYSLIC